VRELKDLYRLGRFQEVAGRAPACEYAPEALRWLGLSLVHLQRRNEQSVELLPRNRCRPSFNNIVREVAEETPGVWLLDLDELAMAAHAPGLPGERMFLDYCHFDHNGYAWVADQLRAKLRELNIDPPGDPQGPGIDREAFMRRTRLDLVGVQRD
jgi:hypothetical protein